MSYFHQDSVFWIEVDKIDPNPYQPRKEFDSEELESLASSIRQYGVLQALLVTRQEHPKEDGGLSVKYELISGERRLRAAKLSGVKQVPVLIRSGEESDLMKLEMAIIENLQREDLNVVERARAFDKLAKNFSFNKTQISKKVGKSREYVSNTMRVLSLPDFILDSLSIGKISEGHARPLLMLCDRKDEQQTLFKEILYKKISVREAERIAKKVAKDKVRKPGVVNPEIEMLEREFTESLGTRVNIESKEVGGKISIDYFSKEDLHTLLDILKLYKKQGNAPMLENFLAQAEQSAGLEGLVEEALSEGGVEEDRNPSSETDHAEKEETPKGEAVSEESLSEPFDRPTDLPESLERSDDTVLASDDEAPKETELEKRGIWEKISTSFSSFNEESVSEDRDGKDVRAEEEVYTEGDSVNQSEVKDRTPETFAGVTSYESTEYLRSEEPVQFSEPKEEPRQERADNRTYPEEEPKREESANPYREVAQTYREESGYESRPENERERRDHGPEIDTEREKRAYETPIGRESQESTEEKKEGHDVKGSAGSAGLSSTADYDDDDLYSVRNFSV